MIRRTQAVLLNGGRSSSRKKAHRALLFLLSAANHAGRVKCILIDPPYNTGNRDFIYNDRFLDKDDPVAEEKVDAEHKFYGRPLMLTLENGRFMSVRFNPQQRRNETDRVFSLDWAVSYE